MTQLPLTHSQAMTKVSTEIDAFARKLNNNILEYALYYTGSTQLVGLALTIDLGKSSPSVPRGFLRDTRCKDVSSS